MRYNTRMTRIGVSTAAYYGRLETEDAAAKLAELGLPCCEVFLQSWGEYKEAFGKLVRARLGATEAVSVHNTTLHFERDILGQSPRQREDAFALMDGFLSAGQALDAHVYVFHGPPRLRGSMPDFARWQEPIERAIALAASHGITMAWETVSYCHVSSPERAVAIAERWPDMRFVLDVKQVVEAGFAPEAFVRALGDKICHVHALDFDAEGRYALPGRGVYDFRILAEALREHGYAGDVILEPYSFVVESDAALMASVAYLRDVFC